MRHSNKSMPNSPSELSRVRRPTLNPLMKQTVKRRKKKATSKMKRKQMPVSVKKSSKGSVRQRQKLKLNKKLLMETCMAHSRFTT